TYIQWIEKKNQIKQRFKMTYVHLKRIAIEIKVLNTLFRWINVFGLNVEVERNFNVWCTRLDVSSSSHFRSYLTRNKFLEVMQEQNLLVVLREINPHPADKCRLWKNHSSGIIGP
uniref:Uncharacterized protein n=1 Tax=Fundulus heteroclitus TaxID=8078 RepID=A0A3Q2QDC9_FUNHE